MTAERPDNLTAAALQAHGLYLGEGRGLLDALVYERPVWLFDPRRVKNCTFGAFSYVNGLYTTSLFDCRVGRYCSIAEAVIAGAYEHPTNWLSTHPFLFADPEQFHIFQRMPDFTRLSLGPPAREQFDDERVTTIGHDVWIGAAAFIKRGVTIGDGAIIAAHAVVTRDVPPYAIVAGQPARQLRDRFDARTVERLQRLAWWRYDLAPHKEAVDFRNMDTALDALEERIADGRLQVLAAQTGRVVPRERGYFSHAVADALYT